MELLLQTKIRTARNVFTKNKDTTILTFVHAYNVQNDFNQIPHVVGSHIDHSPGGQSFENRTSVVHKHFNGYVWGGGLFTAEYTWSIVDWESGFKANHYWIQCLHMRRGIIRMSLVPSFFLFISV